MAMAIAKTLLDTLDLRAGSTITESEISALKKRWRGMQRKAMRRGELPDYSSEWEALLEALPMRVSDEQGKKGLDYLRKLLLKKDGTLRDTKLVKDQDLSGTHAGIIQRADHFLFTGFREDLNHFGNPVALYPIYRLVSHDDQWFEYVARPWVAGLPEFSQVGEEMPS